ncbi:unnamed protein product [Lymnaea stagnalis]|uniref:AIG1-type G domain-containing protein n=1 Tax=Lymnaea stagnalis TaxID=6523 RepID=A0AAV2HB73_LYMST
MSFINMLGRLLVGGPFKSAQPSPQPSPQSRPDPKLLKTKLNFLVVGKTGNGKSSSCKAIADLPDDSPHFASYNSSTAITKSVGNYRIHRWGKEISVTDTPGLEDTELDDIANVKFARKNMINAMNICPEGFHAIVLVLRWDTRFNNEDQRVIQVLTEIFGEEMFQFTILIFTHGDSFDSERNITNENASQRIFKTWCRQQEGALGNLLAKCSFRVVLFHNAKSYEDKRDVDMIELKRETEGIIQGGTLYTDEQFGRQRYYRDRILINKFLDELKKQINESLTSLKKEFKLITTQEKKFVERIDEVLKKKTSHLPDLDSLMKDLEDLKGKLQVKRKNQEKRELYSKLQSKIDTQLFLSLKLLSDDLKKVIKPEWHKEDLKHRAMALQSYIREEDYGTRKLTDELENIDYFLSEINDLDTKGKGVFTEIE